MSEESHQRIEFWEKQLIRLKENTSMGIQSLNMETSLMATHEEAVGGWALVGEVTTVNAGSFLEGRPAWSSRGEVKTVMSVSPRLDRADMGSSNTGGGDLSVSARWCFFFLTFSDFSSSKETGLVRGRPRCLLAVVMEDPSIRALLGAGPPGSMDTASLIKWVSLILRFSASLIS
jgi:hypothetical protein